MRISKNGKRLMSFALSAAMLLACVLYVPKEAGAADGDAAAPTVLGATLRLSDKKDDAGGSVDNNGRQSLRIGIEVPNASKVKSCQISLTVGDKTKVISTEPVAEGVVDYQHNKILSYDEGSDTAVYAVVIAGIGKENFYTPIEITGACTSIDGGDPIPSSTEERNVMGVVGSLQAKYPELKIDIDENGNLFTNGSKDDKLELTDIEGYDDSKPHKVADSVDLSKEDSYSLDTTFNGATMEAKYADGALDVTFGQFGGIVFKAPDDGKVYKYAQVTYTGEKSIQAYLFDDKITDNGVGQNAGGQHQVDDLAAPAEGATATYEVAADFGGGRITAIKLVNVSSDKKLLKISSVTFFTENPDMAPVEPVGNLFERNVAYNDQQTNSKFNADGTLDLSLWYEYSGFGICMYINDDHADVDLADYSKLVIEYDSADSYPMLVEFKTGDDIKNDYWGNGAVTVPIPNPDGKGDTQTYYTQFNKGSDKFEIPLDGVTESGKTKAKAVFIKYNNYVPEGQQGRTDNAEMTIKSIKLYE